MTDDCIPWQGTVSSTGYGLRWLDGKYVLAHRHAYCQHHGLPLSSIKGQMVLHSCDYRRCVNPHHLRLGNHADNMRDMVERGRWAGGRPRGLTPEQEAEVRETYVPRCRQRGTRALARKHGVNQSTIARVLSREAS